MTPDEVSGIRLTIAKHRIAFDPPPPYQDVLAVPAYRAFLKGDSQVDAHLTFHVVDQAELDSAWAGKAAARGYPFESCPIMNCQTVELRYKARQPDELLLPNLVVADFLQPATWTMESFVLDCADESQCLRGRLFRLLGCLLSAGDGLLLHGSGFVLDGVAAAVIGPSKAGKTTAARLVRGDRLLSDDVVAVTDLDGQPQLHATPLGHESDGVGSAPLRAVFFPRKQAAFSLQPLTARQALIRSAAEQADTFQGLFVPYGGMSIRNLGRLFRKVPAYELGFSLDGIDREAIRRVLSKS
jgi:hypothetical protein